MSDLGADLEPTEVIKAPSSPLPPESGSVENVGESGEESEDEWNYYAPHHKQDKKKEEVTTLEEEAMSSPLNPDAPAFVPTSADILAGNMESFQPTNADLLVGVCGNMDALRDVVAASPQKPLPVLEPPDDDTFTNEAAHRPNEVHVPTEHQNGNDSFCELNPNPVHDNGDSTAAFDNDAFLRDLQRVQNDTTNLVDIQVSYGSDVDELAERLRSKESDPMTRSFYGQEDLNAVHRLPSDDDDDLESHKLAYEQVPESMSDKNIPPMEDFRQYGECDEDSPLTEKDDFDTEKEYNQSPFIHHDLNMKETSVDVSEESNNPQDDLATGIETSVDDDPMEVQKESIFVGDDSANIVCDIIPESNEVEHDNENEVIEKTKVLETDLDDEVDETQCIEQRLEHENFINHNLNGDSKDNEEVVDENLAEPCEKIVESFPMEVTEQQFDEFSQRVAEHMSEDFNQNDNSNEIGFENEANFTCQNLENKYEEDTERQPVPDTFEPKFDDFVHQKNVDFLQETFENELEDASQNFVESHQIETSEINGFGQNTNPFGDNMNQFQVSEELLKREEDFSGDYKKELANELENVHLNQNYDNDIDFLGEQKLDSKLEPELIIANEQNDNEPYTNNVEFSDNEQFASQKEEINLKTNVEENLMEECNQEPVMMMNGKEDYSISDSEIVKDTLNDKENIDLHEETNSNLVIEPYNEQVDVSKLESEVSEERLVESQSESSMTDIEAAPAQNAFEPITNDFKITENDIKDTKEEIKEVIPDLIAQTESSTERLQSYHDSAPPPTPAVTEAPVDITIAQPVENITVPELTKEVENLKPFEDSLIREENIQTSETVAVVPEQSPEAAVSEAAIAAGAIAAAGALAATVAATETVVKKTGSVIKKPSTPAAKTPTSAKTPSSAKTTPAKPRTPVAAKPATTAATRASLSKTAATKTSVASKTTATAKTNGLVSKTNVTATKTSAPRIPATTRPAVGATKAPAKPAPAKTTAPPKPITRPTTTTAPKPAAPKTTTAPPKPAAPRPITRPTATKPATTTASKTTTGAAPKPAAPKTTAPRVPLSRPLVKTTTATSKLDTGAKGVAAKTGVADKKPLTNGHARPPIRRPTDAKPGLKDIKQTKELANKRLTGSKEVKSPIKAPVKAPEVKPEMNVSSEA